MKRNHFFVFVFIWGVTLSLPLFVMADDAPGLPASFYGTATFNGDPLPAGSLIRGYYEQASATSGEIMVNPAGYYGMTGPEDEDPCQYFAQTDESLILSGGTGTIYFKTIVSGFNNGEEITADGEISYQASARRLDLTFTATADTVSVCSPSSVAHGTVAAYPGCSISCDSDYTLSGNSCISSSGGGGGDSSDETTPETPETITSKKDITGDDKVDFDDFAIFALLYGKSYSSDSENVQGNYIIWGDYDDDGDVDFSDFAEFALHYGK